MQSIFFSKKKRHIGNIKFDYIKKNAKYANLGILIGDNKFRNKGLSKEIIETSTNFISKKFNIKKFILGVKKNNIAAINAYKKCGFRIFKDLKNTYEMKLDLNLLNLNKLSLGSAQFGMNYGINNKFGKSKFKEVKKIIKYSEKIGIRSIDTASAYGNAEKILGKIGVKNFKITSKLPFIIEQNIKDIEKIVKTSLSHLKIKKLDCLLIHSSKNLENNTKIILQKMKKLKIRGLVTKIGISITNFKDAYKVLKKYNFDVIQLPYNIVDRRLQSKKLVKLLKYKKVIVQIRSIFLQGLLFKKYSKISSSIKYNSKGLIKLKKFLSKSKKTKLNYMTNFVYQNSLPKNYVLGVDNYKQIIDISKIKIINSLNYNDLSSNDENLINPTLWK